MKQTQDTACPMDALLRLLMGPWTTYILWVLRQQGPTRFGQLKRQLPGISSRVLTQRLRMLASADVIFRDYKPTIPPEVTYGLTGRGMELGDVLDSLNAIASRWVLVEVNKKAKSLGWSGGCCQKRRHFPQ